MWRVREAYKSLKNQMKAADRRNIDRLISAMVVVVVVLALIGAPKGVIDFVVNIFVNMIGGAMISLALGYLIEGLTGDLLKGVLFTVDIMGFEFSLSLFTIATIILKLILFP